MADREKVIRGLECHATKGFVACQDCPYYPDELIYEDDDDMEGTICEEKLAADAIALLKEQDEGVTPIRSTTEQKKFADRIGFAVSDFWCGACRFNLVGHPKFCPNCGKKVKWDE